MLNLIKNSDSFWNFEAIHFDGTTCNTFFSLLDKTLLLNAKNQSPNVAVDSQCQYSGLAALPFLFVYWERNKTAKQFGYVCERAEGRMEACNPLNLKHHTFSICLYWKGALIQSHLCFWLFLFPYILTKPFCPIWLGLFASDTFSAYRLMGLISKSGKPFTHQSLSVLSFCLSAARPWFSAQIHPKRTQM